ncbi:hypothetical protein JN09_000981 [Acholeplasma morum]|jgi:hypothetical protein|uniref:hypothetical protein n=1 Tax=Paracholeplasma morum TaxID=264637 RepID=UPI0019581D5A|nr:hypothetical protein [Paracholeplasma morum]MBM7453649.1 hypothetical protein [Paracholeplasma morum]
MKHFLYELKQPLIKSDLKRFLVEGILSSIIFGAFIGALDFYLTVYFQSILSIFTFLIFYYFLSNRLFRSFNQYHIIYSILSVVFLLIGVYMMGFTSQIFYLEVITGNIALYHKFLNPLIYFDFVWKWSFDISVIFFNLLYILIYVWICRTIYMQMKR